MRLLLDQNISPALTRSLADVYPHSIHVRDVNLRDSLDEDIWAYAANEKLVIVTKDDDFRELSVLRGHPPKVIWLTIGNCTTLVVERLLREHRQQLDAFAQHDLQSLIRLPQ